MILKARVLDLFCGMGGWSKGFHALGFLCTGIDIIDHGYPYDLILQDITTLDGQYFKGYDVIIGSPPCTDFSTATEINKSIPGRKTPNRERGLILVKEFIRIIQEAKPKLYAFENVARLKQFFHEKPIWEFMVSVRGKRCLWGNIEFPLMPYIRFPNRNMEYDYTKYSYKMRSALRSEIPFPIAFEVAKVCKNLLC